MIESVGKFIVGNKIFCSVHMDDSKISFRKIINKI
jgi:hypothetical protein